MQVGRLRQRVHQPVVPASSGSHGLRPVCLALDHPHQIPLDHLEGGNNIKAWTILWLRGQRFWYLPLHAEQMTLVQS